MDRDTFRVLNDHARRLRRNAADAADLVQDVLVIALQTGRSDLPWLIGVLQKQAAMAARSAVRRRARDAASAGDDVEPSTPADNVAAAAPQRAATVASLLARLAPAARRVAVLALHGLDADEIRWILALSPTAFRQRLTSIRKTLGVLPEPLRSEALALAYVRDPARTLDLQFGLVRRALKAALRDAPGLATHDADGHLLVIRAAHTSPSRGNGQA